VLIRLLIFVLIIKGQVWGVIFGECFLGREFGGFSGGKGHLVGRW